MRSRSAWRSAAAAKRSSPPPRVSPAAFPDATSRMAVFVHGLCENEESWRQFPLRGARARRRTYGERLQDELSFTPVDAALQHRAAHLRERPRAGAVARGADLGLADRRGGDRARRALDGRPGGAQRLPLRRDRRAPLGRPASGTCSASAPRTWERTSRRGPTCSAGRSARLPETRAFGSLLNARSVGIKDLRFGSCVEEDWCDCEPDEFLRDRCQEVPFLPDANYYFIGATLSEARLGVGCSAICWCACRARPAAATGKGAADPVRGRQRLRARRA